MGRVPRWVFPGGSGFSLEAPINGASSLKAKMLSVAPRDT